MRNYAMFLVACLLTVSVAAAGNREQEFFDAIRKGDAPKVTELLKQDPSLMKASYRNGITPVLLAVYAKHPDLAETLLSKTGREPDIFEATITGRIDRVRQLLKQNPDLVHAWSADGWTALHLNWGNVEMARLLIESGSDINANSRNHFNATPLQGAAATNRLEIAKLYLSHGANVNCRSEDGGSPLHEAAGNGFLDFARLLVERGANINQRDDNGKTPLTIAIESKQPALEAFLREKGATE